MPGRIDYYDDPARAARQQRRPLGQRRRRQRRRRDPADPPHRQRQLGAARRRDGPRRVAARRAVRETPRRPAIDFEITGLVGIYTDPRHVILYTSNGEARQEFSIVFTARPLGGEPTPSDESREVRWVARDEVAAPARWTARCGMRIEPLPRPAADRPHLG